MSERKQGTACNMHRKMVNRYGDELFHKHNKDHSLYRMHYRTHPVQIFDISDSNLDKHSSTGLIRAIKLRRMRKRADKGSFH